MTTTRPQLSRRVRRGTLSLLVLTAALGAAAYVLRPVTAVRPAPAMRTWTIEYTAWNGATRPATVLLPSWYGPESNPPIPVVISPHGRGCTGKSNAKYWGNLPAVGGFGVINPDGNGRVLKRLSYGYAGQIDDLAKMPDLAEHALPWLRIDRSRVYALGSSMGGQETLLLVARHPHLLAGAAALDSVTDLARRYSQLPLLPCDGRCLERYGKPVGLALQERMSKEVGGTPAQRPRAYASRSAADLARKIAFSGVPLQIWWSSKDQIVVDQAHQSQALFDKLRRLNPCAPVSAYAGRWKHSSEMRATALLPVALADLGLLPGHAKQLTHSVRHVQVPSCSAAAGLR